MGKLFNRADDETKRRQLRRKSPPAEILFWQEVRARRLGGFKFRRQYSIANYITDFCCPEIRLIVELDGPSHEGEDAVEYDVNRQHYLESLGFTIVRFKNEQIYTDVVDVLETLLRICEASQKNEFKPFH